MAAHCRKFNFAGATLAAAAGLAVSATAQAQINNGGFESGDFTSWTIDGTTNTPVIVGAPVHSGASAALLGNNSGAEPNGNSSFYQTFAVPAGGGNLTFWFQKYTVDSITFDWQDAYITDSTGATNLATIFHTCATIAAWTQQTVDMTPYAGTTVGIKFLVHQDGFGDDTSMTVDDVSFASASATGACCMPDGSCVANQTSLQCTTAGGAWAGANVTCGAANCPQPGACCLLDGTCSSQLQAACVASGGFYQGAGTTCGAGTCNGACCTSAGTCSIQSPNACAASAGIYWGNGVTCAAANCPTSYYFVDDGTAEDGYGYGGTVASVAYCNTFTSTAGEDLITGVDVAFGGFSGISGAPVTAYIWSDPNQDGNPTDAQVLATSAPGVIMGAQPSFPWPNPMMFLHFAVPPTQIPLGQKFFVGFVANNCPAGYPGSSDYDNLQHGSWFGSVVGANFNPNAWTGVLNLDSAYTPPAGAEWLIRADAVPSDPNAQGACCLAAGSCVANQTLAQCQAQSGVWAGQNVTCAAANCPQPGACCNANGTCSMTNAVGGADCTANGGTYQGNNTTCANVNCPQPGACCHADGTCSYGLPAACAAVSGVFSGAGVTCAQAACPQPPTITCGLTDGTLTDISPSSATPGTLLGTGDDSVYNFISSVTNALVPSSNLYACTNGFISDSSTYNSFTNTTIPQAAVNLGLWGDWDDLYVLGMADSGIYHLATTQGGVNVEIVQWHNSATFAQTTVFGDFEIKIFAAPGGPNGALIQYIYPAMEWDWNGNSSTVGYQRAGSAIIGMGLNGNSTNGAGGPIADNTNCDIKAPATGPSCYANCDGSTGVPFLNVTDFTCFLQKFGTGNAYANCDGSTNQPTLNVADFTCFLQKFGIGCSAP